MAIQLVLKLQEPNPGYFIHEISFMLPPVLIMLLLCAILYSKLFLWIVFCFNSYHSLVVVVWTGQKSQNFFESQCSSLQNGNTSV